MYLSYNARTAIKKIFKSIIREKHDAIVKTSSQTTRQFVFLTQFDRYVIVVTLIRLFIIFDEKTRHWVESKECFYPNAQRTI